MVGWRQTERVGGDNSGQVTVNYCGRDVKVDFGSFPQDPRGGKGQPRGLIGLFPTVAGQRNFPEEMTGDWVSRSRGGASLECVTVIRCYPEGQV